MAAKKKRTKPAPVGNLTAVHLDKMSKRLDEIAEGQAELVGVVKAFKLDVQVNFRELQDKLVSAIATAVAESIAHAMGADRERMSALEARITELERKAS